MQSPKEPPTDGNREGHSQTSGTNPDAFELLSLRPTADKGGFHEDAATTKGLHTAPKRRLFGQGWRFAVINCAISVTIVFICNLSITALSTHMRKHMPKSTASELIFEDNCNRVRSLNTWLHLIINLLSTILLAGSNYCMQCLSAPTRSEVDQAHAKGVWLDIGVPSTRNLRFISKRRAIVWAMLGLSSLPLHLFYNSMVYNSIPSHDYYAINVQEAFLGDQNCLNCDIVESPMKEVIIDLHHKARNNELKRLEPKDCIDEYAIMIQTLRRNVLLVGSDDSFSPIDAGNRTSISFNDTRVYGYSKAGPAGSFYGPYDWICPDAGIYNPPLDMCLSLVDGVKNGAQWTVNDFNVNYCLSEEAPPVCRLHIVLSIGWLVTFLNLFKALLILYTVLVIQDDPLMTMGDAVTSFIKRPDPWAKGLCLLTAKEVKKQLAQPTSEIWTAKVDRWKDVTSKTRRVTTIVMCIIVLIIVSILLSIGVKGLKRDGESTSLQALNKIGFGAIDPRTVINWDIGNTMENILIANLAQPVLSFLYFSYNGLFTCMLLGFEWSQYAYKRKGLRVSTDRSGAQRATYYLQLPYRYSLPLVGLSGLLHWLTSQSIFLVAINYYDPFGNLHSPDYGRRMSCGYSPIAIISVLVLGILMLIACIGFGYIPYKPGMNLVGSCSVAMSAACHMDEWNPANGCEAAQSRLQWGVVGMREDGVGHCAFSMREVEFPMDGKKYA